jgi:glutathione S-transferase
MLTVWGRKSSSNVQALMWCIGELNLPFERIDAGFTYEVVDTDEYLAMNPNGTVPTIQDDSNPPLWETGAILRYLASEYAPESFWPANNLSRAEVDRWSEWSKVNIALNFTGPIFWRVARTPLSRRDPEAIRRALKVLDKYLAIADKQLSRFEYIAADHLTLADMQFGHCLYRYFDIDIDRKDWRQLRRYYNMLAERPAFKEHIVTPYDELIDSL